MSLGYGRNSKKSADNFKIFRFVSILLEKENLKLWQQISLNQLQVFLMLFKSTFTKIQEKSKIDLMLINRIWD